MRITLLALACVVSVMLAVGCGGGSQDSTSSSTATPNGVATLSGLQGQLAAILLQQSDVPQGLDGSAPAFSTNEDVAGSDTQMLQTLVQEGRQLGVDVQFVPTNRLDSASPIKGGIQSSASVYTNVLGATQSYDDTANQARANNWQANYPALRDLRVTTVQETVGDESLWLRISGVECQSGTTASPPPSCSDASLVALDNVILRVGRVRAYLQVSSVYAIGGQPEQLQSQILQWAQAVADRASQTFPS